MTREGFPSPDQDPAIAAANTGEPIDPALAGQPEAGAVPAEATPSEPIAAPRSGGLVNRRGTSVQPGRGRRAGETDTPTEADTDHAAAAAGSAAVRGAVATPETPADSEPRSRNSGGLVGRRGTPAQPGRGRRAQESQDDSSAAVPATPITPLRSSTPQPETPAADEADKSWFGGLVGRRSSPAQPGRGRRAQDSQDEQRPATQPATPDQNSSPDSNAQPSSEGRLAGLASRLAGLGGGLVNRRGAPAQPGRARRGTDTDPTTTTGAPAPANPSDPLVAPHRIPHSPRRAAAPNPGTPPAPASPAAAPAAPTPRSREKLTLRDFTPGGIAVRLAVRGQLLFDGVKDKLQLEQENRNLSRTLNTVAAVAIIGRFAWAGYAAAKGISAGGGNNEALHAVSELSSSSQPGAFTKEAMDQAAPQMKLVGLEQPLAAPAAVTDPSDIAPAAVKLGDWKNENSDDGTVWGTTMDYLEKMGVETDDLTDKQKYEIVDDLLDANNVGGKDATEAERWDAAENMSSDFEVKLPSANGMEDILDAHGVKHNELDPIVEAPKGDNTNPGDTNGDTNTGKSSGTQPTPGPTPSTPADHPSGTPNSSSPKPEDVAPRANGDEWYTKGDNWKIIGSEATDAALASAALYGALGVGGGVGITAKEASKSQPKRRPTNRPGGSTGPRNRSNGSNSSLDDILNGPRHS